ncbi:peroxisomal membrane protein Pex17 [Xylariales sp. PMI_506]|nr:peroxisomal membrane protein Pex17 [Xylariales sp. PMI_506]
MSADRLLTATLRACQEPPDPSQVDKIFGTTHNLLARLNNPLNISLLTSHVLTARAIWERPDGLRTSLRIISVYSSAARRVIQNAEDNAKLSWGQQPTGSEVKPDQWARAVAKGADERSSRWKHLLVLTGILVGMEGEGRRTLSSSLKSTLEQAVITASNLALSDRAQTQEYGTYAVILALSYAFPVLSDWNRPLMDCNLVLPAALLAMIGPEGFEEGEFLRMISAGNVAGHEAFYRASPDSFAQVQQIATRPLVQNMGPLSRLAVFAVEHATDSRIVLQGQRTLVDFSAGMLEKWRQCPFSDIDISTEAAVLPAVILQGPWNMLWQLLKKIMYTVVCTVQPIIGRCLLDPHLRNDNTAPGVAAAALHMLRNLYFISSRQGGDAFQYYTFTYLTSIDILARYPEACIAFLRETQPAPDQQSNFPPTTVLDHILALFYLNTAEHLPLSLPTAAAENLIMTPATAHLSVAVSSQPSGFPQTSLILPLFEAAHASILSVMSCPQHAALTVSVIPFYVDVLLGSFPARISPRQFRLAFKTVMQIVSPPFPISATHPELSEALLEALHYRAASASSAPLAAETLPPSPLDAQQQQQQQSDESQQQPPISEQTTLVLALVDALPFLPLPLVEEWLARAAEAMSGIRDATMREVVRKRYWDVLVSGEMDVERAAIGVAWWGTKGGREMVLLNAPRAAIDGAEDSLMMSGALGNKGESRL